MNLPITVPDAPEEILAALWRRFDMPRLLEQADKISDWILSNNGPEQISSAAVEGAKRRGNRDLEDIKARAAGLLELQRRQLAAMPRLDEIDEIEATVVEALAVRTERRRRENIAFMLGAFPNARPADPEVYVAALLHDSADLPDVAVALAARHCRRNCKFCPAVAEFLEAAQATWKQIQAEGTFIPRRLRQGRKLLEDALAANEAAASGGRQ